MAPSNDHGPAPSSRATWTDERVIEQLFTHFDRLMQSPASVQRLRRFILELAVRGKLVPQSPNDEPASISPIEKKQREHQQVCSTDIPGWLVAPVGLLLEFRYGKGMKASERLDEGPVPVFGSNGVVGYCETPLTETPSIIVGRKGSAGALNLCDGPSWTMDVAYFVEAPAFFDLRYLLIELQILNLELLGKGVKPGLSRSDAYNLSLNVPPLPEQHRIVAKVDELMRLCDRLEAVQAERETTRTRLTSASLVRLNAPDPDAAKFREHVKFALNNFTPLTTRPEQIKALRQTILNLAMRGKLVPQDPEEEPASKLLQRIVKAKARLVKAGEIKRPKKLPPIDKIPYSLPPSWHWTRIREITSDRGQRVPEAALTYIDVTSIDKKNGRVAGTKVLQANEAPSRARKVVQKGDVMYSCVRPYLLNVAVVDHDFDPKPIASTAFAVLNGHGLVLPRYLWIVLRSPFMVARVEKNMRGQAYPAINDTDFSILPFPLPPLAEQHRIVAKVDELMEVCDRLEGSTEVKDEARGQLFRTLLHNALERPMH